MSDVRQNKNDSYKHLDINESVPSDWNSHQIDGVVLSFTSWSQYQLHMLATLQRVMAYVHGASSH